MDYTEPVSTINNVRAYLTALTTLLLDKHSASEAYHKQHSSSDIFTYRAGLIMMTHQLKERSTLLT